MYIRYTIQPCPDDMRIQGFLWDEEDDEDGNVAHIARHGVDADEVEEALTLRPLVLRTGDGRYLGYGKTADGRPLFVVFVPKEAGLVKPLTARTMTDREKRLYRKKAGKMT